MIGERLRRDGIFDEGDFGHFNITEWEELGSVGGMLVDKTSA